MSNSNAPHKHSHYYKPVTGLTHVDVYRVLQLFNVTDPCLQHAVKKLLVAGGRGGGKDITRDIQEAIDTLTRWKSRQELVDPLYPIPLSATEVHRISDEMVKGKPNFAALAKDLMQLVLQLNQGGSVCVGYNVRKYDWPLLQAEFGRLGFVIQTPLFIDVCDLACWHFRHLQSRKLSAIAAHLNVPFAEDEAHEALADVRKSFEVLAEIRKLCNVPDDLEGDMQLVHRSQVAGVRLDAEYDAFGSVIYRCRDAWDSDVFRVGMGKHCGTLLTELRDKDPRYCDWMVREVLPSGKPQLWEAFTASGFDLTKYQGPWNKPRMVRG